MPAKLSDRRMKTVITIACEFCDADLLVLQDTPEIRCRYCSNFTPVARLSDEPPAEDASGDAMCLVGCGLS